MAMLQLGGTLSSASVRTTPRVGWSIAAAQHFLNASSMGPDPSPVIDSTTIKDNKLQELSVKQEVIPKRMGVDRSLTMAAFKSLRNTRTNLNSEKLSDRMKSATSVSELLEASKDPLIELPSSSGGLMRKRMDNARSVFQYDNLRTGKTKYQVDRLSVQELITIATTLAKNQKRSIPLLQALAKKLTETNEELNIKQLGDTLYSMAVLNFYDEGLILKISKELLKVISRNERSAVIGSILTSLGVLRFRDEKLIDELSTWIVQHRDHIRPQEISSLLVTLAYLGYTPQNFDEVTEHIIRPLRESDMSQSSEWLDIVWALTVLNQATLEHYESILNSGFLNRLFDMSELSASKTLKLLNVNAAARLSTLNYQGPLLPEGSTLYQTSVPRTKEKIDFSNSIVSALKILLPSDSFYLNININTEMGFLLDALFCVDSKCTPHHIESNTDKPVFSIAVLACVYHEFCRGKSEVIGPVKLYKQLLEQQGYKVLLIPYTEVKIKDKLVTRVKYINDNIKALVQNSSE